VEPNRGDYYLTSEGDMVQTPGRWLMDEETMERLGIDTSGLHVSRDTLTGHEIPLQAVHYGLRQGDRVAFTTQHRPPQAPRVENGTRGEITHIDPQQAQVTVTLTATSRSPATISRRYASPTPNTSTASREQPWIARSS
jgi:hypothetical protein